MNDDTAKAREFSGRGRPGGGGRRRQPPQLVEVVSASRITPRLVSVRVEGGDLSSFGTAAPTSHIKLFLPVEGQEAPALPIVTPEGRVWPTDAPRPIVRTYTARRFDADADAGTLEIQFVLHGEGPASRWAERARNGDKIAVAGPGGRFSSDLAARRWWIAGDESALPAVGALLEALPASAVAEVHLEVAGPEDEIPLMSAARVATTWHHRREPEAWGAELADASVKAEIGGAQVWVACEASAMRLIRRSLLERGVPGISMVTRGYWRRGVADHPDHDYGED
ncbi:siderophore-interacting protein [Frankia sp. CNm7]|uniref:Siderophore-interacting protein n=1 Tax=Frankia nepalensis TaxID=1836974 RepID=A0A937UUD3_9ACTN|nr:siderophore-interacting protein [Frankia nepalensis]MBL7497567.1 siderophore-interacting protein [Frankia nepalensis]MBL7509620.1 siderophore-interacting protein [Frankia nepalensis]MBL7517107.1 siderophore-interacting protein [Frankia nepalensis]MBL7631021.1 siderophore-interacting protein [Frankia nepalensis]